jgi:hypothetical protein
MLAALVVALLGVLPAEHVHAPEAPGAGESVIHRHVVEAHSSSADSVLGHGDHATAVSDGWAAIRCSRAALRSSNLRRTI